MIRTSFLLTESTARFRQTLGVCCLSLACCTATAQSEKHVTQRAESHQQVEDSQDLSDESISPFTLPSVTGPFFQAEQGQQHPEVSAKRPITGADVQMRASEKRRHYLHLNRQIDLVEDRFRELRRQREEPRSEIEIVAPPETGDDVPASGLTASNEPPKPTETSPELNEGPDPQADASSTSQDTEGESPDLSGNSETTVDSDPPVSDVMSGPIDRLALADSLYANHEYVMAEEIYSGLLSTPEMAGEKFWIEYQLAGCYRHLERPNEANEAYRRLAGESDAGWLAELARWWLDQAVQVKEIDSELSATDRHIQQLQGVIDALSSP